MKDLNDAKVLVETRFSIDSCQNNGNWFTLSDYSTIGEFFIDCAAWFDGEENPEYVYTEWENIPGGMIDRHWISPNLFELRDALQSVGESQLVAFRSWCATYGWNPATDEPNKIVSDFMESADSMPTDDDEQPAWEEPGYMFLYDTTGASFEIFNDNYN